MVRTVSFLVRSGRLRSGHGTKCLETTVADTMPNLHRYTLITTGKVDIAWTDIGVRSREIIYHTHVRIFYCICMF